MGNNLLALQIIIARSDCVVNWFFPYLLSEYPLRCSTNLVLRRWTCYPRQDLRVAPCT